MSEGMRGAQPPSQIARQETNGLELNIPDPLFIIGGFTGERLFDMLEQGKRPVLMQEQIFGAKMVFVYAEDEQRA